MRRISLMSLPAWVALFLLSSIASFAQRVSQDRIVQAVDEGRMTALRGNIHPLASSGRDQGRVSPDMPMQNVSIMFRLSSAQQTALDQLIAQQQDPASPNYRKWITPEQYAARFGMTQNDLDKVTTWLQSQGFTGIQVARSHNRISFDGTAARIESAFHTEMHNYSIDGETHFANASEPSIPTAFADMMAGFRGLASFRLKPRLRRLSGSFTSSQTGNHFLTPGDIATIYDIAPLYASGFDGTGVTIVVAGQTLISVANANAFRAAVGLSSNPPQLHLTPNTGISQTFTGDLDEANLDVDWSGGVARGATVIFDYAGATGGVIDAFVDALENNLGQVVAISYGACEPQFGTPTDVQNLHTIVQQGIAQGQSISAASGDSGAADCEGSNSTSATTGLAVDLPGAYPEVISVGGSEFTGDNTVGSDPPYWAGAINSTTDNISSALEYIPETAWNETALAGSLAAGGGGKSTLFTKPAWQSALTPADNARDVPDLSLDASSGHDPYAFCGANMELSTDTGPACTNGLRSAMGNLDLVGGTSVGAQVFGGILAIIDQATGKHGLGNANIEIYSLAGSKASAFHDITTGNNEVPCTSGTTNCPAGTTQIGFAAGTGFDLATGLGSIDVNALATSWPGFPPYTVAGTSVSVSAPGSASNSTITVAPTGTFSGSGSVTLSCTTPGSEITCSFTVPTSGATTSVSITNSSSATATLHITTTAPHARSATGPSAKSTPSAKFGWFTAGGAGLLAGFFMMGAPTRRRRWSAMLALLFCVSLAVGVGCGGGSSTSGGGGGGTTDPGTPAGNYTIVVTGTSGSTTSIAKVTVSVQ